MKVLALALALCFAAAPIQAAPKTKAKHYSSKSSKMKARSHVKRANKASHLKRANRKKVN